MSDLPSTTPPPVQDALLRPSEALGRHLPEPATVAEPLDHEPRPETVVRYGIQIAGVGLMLNEGTQSEVVELQRPYPLPNTPSWLLGLVNLRGNLVPVFDLREVLVFEDPQTGQRDASDKEYLLVVDKGEHAAGFVTEHLPSAIRDVGRALSAPVVPAVLRHHVSSAWLRGDSVWFDFDHRSFLEALTSELRTA